MIRWLLAGSLALGVCAGQAQAGEEAPVAVQPEVTPAGAAQVASAQEASAPETKQQDTKQQDTQQKQEPKGEEKGEKKEAEAPAAPPPTGPWHYNATADFYWENNFNNPFTGRNALRAFDIIDDHAPQFNYAGITVFHDRKPFGFRIDAGFGESTELFNATEPLTGTARDAFQLIQQVFASANLDKKGLTYVDVGKWYTPVGLEVFVARDNWNYSRSLLYNFAEPFYHLGARLYKYKNATDYWMVNVNRGWNNVGTRPLTDNIGGGVSYGKQASKKLNAVVNTMVSDEPDFVGIGHTRYLADLVLNYVASPKWTFAMNGDYWHQSNFLLAPVGPEVSANVGGVAGYARRTLNKKDAFTVRAEFLSDGEGAAGTGAAQTVWETTLTLEHRLNKYSIAKLEYRHDSSDVPTFPTEDPAAPSHGQDTLGAALILSY